MCHKEKRGPVSETALKFRTIISRYGVAKMAGSGEPERSVLKYVSTGSHRDGYLQTARVAYAAPPERFSA
jgi:hypothetical protein